MPERYLLTPGSDKHAWAQGARLLVKPRRIHLGALQSRRIEQSIPGFPRALVSYVYSIPLCLRPICSRIRFSRGNGVQNTTQAPAANLSGDKVV